MSIKAMNLTGAAILVSRDTTLLQWPWQVSLVVRWLIHIDLERVDE